MDGRLQEEIWNESIVFIKNTFDESNIEEKAETFQG